MLHQRLKALRSLRVTDAGVVLEIIGVIDKSYTAHTSLRWRTLRV
jgi:hypothetical protein